MKRILSLISFAFLLLHYSQGQTTIKNSDIKGLWVSTMLCVDGKGDYIPIPKDGKVVCFGFTESKGKLNQSRYTGVYRVVNEDMPKLIYYSIEGRKVILFDSSDNKLNHYLEIETVIPKVSMTAKIVDTVDNSNAKMIFVYYEKDKR